MKKTAFLWLLWLAAMAGCKTDAKKTDWSRHYDSTKKTPYGLYVLRKEMEENIFPESEIKNIKGSTYSFFDTLTTPFYTTYMYINESNYINDAVFEKLCTFAEQNDVFISSNYFYKTFPDSSYVLLKTLPDTSALNPVKLWLEDIDSAIYTYDITHRKEQLRYFDTLPKDAKVLGYIEYKDTLYPNLIRIHTNDNHYGFILHANPFLFTNYYMLKENDYRYAVDVLSYLQRNGTIYWDGHRTTKRYTEDIFNNNDKSILSFFLSKPALKWAFYLFFITFVGYLIFNYKRMQKAIAIKIPAENNTVSFIKTVATLFMKEKNKADLTKYKINHLMDKVRRTYLLHTEDINDDFIKKIAEKSEVPLAETNSLFTLIQRLRKADFVAKKDFFELNKLMENFISKSKLYDRK